MKRSAYPKYKESGVPWLGKVPAHWDVRRSDGILFSDRNQLNPETFKDETVFHYSIPAVQECGTGLVEEGESIASAKQRITEKCLLVSKLNPRKATICIAEPQQLKTLCSTEFVVLKSRKCDLNFLLYFSQAEIFRQGLDSKVQSVTRSHQRAAPEDIYKFWSAWPPEIEQIAIADFLDRETGRIDTLVAKKWALVGLLKEKRSALISHTVTRGLPADVAREFGLEPHTRFKDSGVEWLGEVPDGWEVKQVKHITRILRGKFTHRPRNDPRMYDGVYPFIQTGDIAAANKYVHEYHQTLSEEGFGVSKQFPRGTLVMTIAANIGDMAILDFEACFPDSIVGFVHNSDVDLDFLYQLFTGMKPAFISTAILNTQLNLNIERIGSLKAGLPPLPEQTAIATFLDQETAKLDKLVEKVEAAITRLQEYRTALITAAVTGKIDVRDKAA